MHSITVWDDTKIWVIAAYGEFQDRVSGALNGSNE